MVTPTLSIPKQTVVVPISVLPRVARTCIGKRFGGFGKRDGIKEEPIHTNLAPDKLTSLRTLRETLKTADPEQVRRMMEITKRMTLFEAVALARETGRLIVSNFVHDGVLTRTDAMYRVRTGTLIIYEAPNQPFGEFVVFEQTKFAVPAKFRGLKNCALAVEYPDFDLKSTGELIVPDEKTIHLITQFPIKDGWYLTHAETGIPCGRQEATNENARFLDRLNEPYLGLLVRYGVVVRRQYVNAGYCGASSRIGVALV